MTYIHPDECVDCGACESVCPVEAISFDADLPDGSHDFLRLNREFFVELGSPGGAGRLGPSDHDPEEIRSWPKAASEG